MFLNPDIGRGNAGLILAASLCAFLGIAALIEKTAAGTPPAVKPEQSSILMLRGHDMWGPLPQPLMEETHEQHLCWGFDELTDYSACG